MAILVAHASKHGATQKITERIAANLCAAGLEVELKPITEVGDVAAYEACVIGGAVYFGTWPRSLTSFVKRNRATLAARPVWLFSSGPLGTAPTDAKDRDVHQSAMPKEAVWAQEALHPRDHHIFFGALDHTLFDLPERVLWALPASHELFIEGDFRDWAEIESWAASIAHELAAFAAR